MDTDRQMDGDLCWRTEEKEKVRARHMARSISISHLLEKCPSVKAIHITCLRSSIYTVHTYRVHYLLAYLLAYTYRCRCILLAWYRNLHRRSPAYGVLPTNRPSWTRRRKRIGDSEKRENAGTLGRRSARTKPDPGNVPAIIGGGHQPVPLSWQIRRH